MLRIGVTGGIGSGKTTVCKVWERMGARVIYADALAKSLMVDDPDLKASIIRTFGEEVYDENNQLDRVALARLAFEEGRVEELNQLVHPVVYREIDKSERDAEQKGVSVTVREAALLLDKGRPDSVDAVVMVVAPEADRIQRVVERDGSDEKQVRERIRSQKDEAELRPLADLVIENTGSRETLEKKAKAIYEELSAIAAGS